MGMVNLVHEDQLVKRDLRESLEDTATLTCMYILVQRELKDSQDIKVLQALQVLQDVEITTVSLVILETLVLQDPKDVLDHQVSKELKVVKGTVSVGQAKETPAHLDHLVIQDLQGYLEVQD